jgi:hypothetical protein
MVLRINERNEPGLSLSPLLDDLSESRSVLFLSFILKTMIAQAGFEDKREE